MNGVLWTLQGVLTLVFCGAGLMKLVVNQKQLASRGMGFAGEVSASSIKMLGTAEFLGGIGVTLPALVKVLPVLAPVAAACLAVVMIGAIGVHVRRHELPAVAVPVVLLASAVVVAWGRLGPYPF